MAVKSFQGKSVPLKLPIATSWPWDVTEPIGYSIAYFYLAYTCYCIPPAFTGIDTTVMSLIFYSGTLFDSISLELEDLGDSVKENSQTSEMVAEKLGKLVQKHNKAVDFCQKVKRTTTYITLLQLISAALQICLGGFCILVSDNFIMTATYVCYSMCILNQTFFYCWGGNVLIEAVSPFS